MGKDLGKANSDGGVVMVVGSGKVDNGGRG